MVVEGWDGYINHAFFGLFVSKLISSVRSVENTL